MDYDRKLNHGKQYKIRLNNLLPNCIDIDGDNISYGVRFDDDLEKVIGGGMQVCFDGTEPYDEVKQAFDNASQALLEAFRLLESYED